MSWVSSGPCEVTEFMKKSADGRRNMLEGVSEAPLVFIAVLAGTRVLKSLKRFDLRWSGEYESEEACLVERLRGLGLQVVVSEHWELLLMDQYTFSLEDKHLHSC